ncbi:hypothetical protein PQQ32_07990 [Brachyspira hyodysenteriae]|uniref:hypothetical protein n=1 Tax=Brachyspira hyodysenteriae TaxID=159 RepID=UPI002B25C6F6|nr:hypothetical protein [Brachyspira hyodysenteriae]WPC36823.1 hypothetical protein PQQ32_07990 [Brachyspira hyodysenteriae]
MNIDSLENNIKNIFHKDEQQELNFTYIKRNGNYIIYLSYKKTKIVSYDNYLLNIYKINKKAKSKNQTICNYLKMICLSKLEILESYFILLMSIIKINKDI